MRRFIPFPIGLILIVGMALLVTHTISETVHVAHATVCLRGCEKLDDPSIEPPGEDVVPPGEEINPNPGGENNALPGDGKIEGGIDGGLDEIEKHVKIPTKGKNLRDSVVNAITFFLSFVSLIALIVIIAAGFILVMSGGSESAVTRARKMIIYAIIGLIVIFFAALITSFFTVDLAGQF